MSVKAMGLFGPWDVLLGWGHCLVKWERDYQCTLPVPALIGRRFLFEVPTLHSIQLPGLGHCFVKYTCVTLSTGLAGVVLLHHEPWPPQSAGLWQAQSNRADQSQTETSKTVSQNKPFPFTQRLPQVLVIVKESCHNQDN
jgi:hypothetical protein